jgi:hypothetical protein
MRKSRFLSAEIMNQGLLLVALLSFTKAAFNPISVTPTLPSVQASSLSDPWEDAVSKALILLENHPNFVQNLISYQFTADEMIQNLMLVEDFEPVLDLIDELKSWDLPIVGNAWDVLIDALNLATPGAGSVLETLEQELKALLILLDKFEILFNLDTVMAATSNFHVNPSQQTLHEWETACGPAISILEGLDSELIMQNARLEELLGSLDQTLETLSTIGSIVGLDDVIWEIKQVISNLFSPIQDLNDDLSVLHQQIQDDVQVMKQVQQIVASARNPSLFGVSGLGSGSTFFSILLGLLVMGGVAFVVVQLSRHSRRKVVVPEAAGSMGPVSQSGDVHVLMPPGIVASTAMATLKMQSGPLAGQSIRVPMDGMLIGRGSTCNLRLKDRTVSREHARLRYAEGGWFLQDQMSAGGTFVNGQKVTAIRLNTGDQVAIGSTNLIFQPEDNL